VIASFAKKSALDEPQCRAPSAALSWKGNVIFLSVAVVLIAFAAHRTKASISAEA